jgi:Domain of unknown function (DUF5615)
VRLLADENFDNRILARLRRRLPALDILRVQDVGLVGAEDPEILAWAAEEGLGSALRPETGRAGRFRQVGSRYARRFGPRFKATAA